MIKEGKANAVWELYQGGNTVSFISKNLKIDRKTVQKIISSEGTVSRKDRSDKIAIDNDLLIKLLKKCDGYGERVHEEATKMGVKISYSALIKKIASIKFKEEPIVFSTPVPDTPGSEFQHDLSTYQIKIGDKTMKLQASSLYYRYSKVRYLKFYPTFNRFRMKSFFYEAIKHFGYTPGRCVIDNTSLVVIRGSGPRAVFSPEMVQFARTYSFTWLAHEIMHSDRKAGVERGFWTIETNFFPGREFSSIEDLNKQAFDWCEARSKRMNKKKQIPINLFNFEKDYMTKINVHMSGPYEQTSRTVDQEGYINFNANSYWVGLRSSSLVNVLEYPSDIKIYSERKQIAEYPLPGLDIKNRRFSPKGMEHLYRPKKVTILPTTQEQELRSLGKQFDDYLNFALKELGPQGRYQMIREIYFLYKKLPIKIFIELIERAQRFSVNQKNSLETMAAYLIGQDKDTFIFDPLLDDLQDIGTINDLYMGHEGEGNERE